MSARKRRRTKKPRSRIAKQHKARSQARGDGGRFVKGGKADGTSSQPRDYLGRFRPRERPRQEREPSLFISDHESESSVEA